MKANKASRTAQYMALFRAIETTRPLGIRLFNDPYATAFLNTGLKKAAQLSRIPFIRDIVQSIIYRKIPGALSSGIARTKYIDDLLYYAINNGAQQVLILGAGFDTRGVRLSFLRNTSVIEIDHPNTSSLKIEAMRSSMGRLPGNINYHQLDFNKESLDDMLTWNPIDLSRPTAIIWEGVTNYLTPSAIENMFRFLSRFAGGSYIIFTYVHQKVLDSPESYYGAEKLLNDLDKIEERWTFGFRPEELKDYLNERGWALLEDKGATEYRRKYMPQNTERGYEFYRVAFAKKRK
ncbi:SAM-dependent methyltransferase [Paraflavitalea sp. CAU 1676]|uniref:class I SAM-dependent methyltransferase n=1 Tax=Paraflavitalea sp. CAU 1676 TaxID=3032598 RepID=UPI0023DB0C74|nr:SAM-dependent methyltransferase [Paraflavitalea sp. CAU 1676]MDF2189363.1 SAM-dependent methyltransferase [Paraflavitalea sp. CAU 1676]